MKKRALCFLLSAVLLLGMVTGLTIDVSAASGMQASESCIALIKELEGFSAKPYGDYGQYSVGYGTACSGADYERYKANGITVDEADAKMRSYIDGIEASLNSFMDKYGLTLKQRQFDALISFTYNLGASWMNNVSNFRTAVIQGYAGNDFIFAITRWCAAGEDDSKQILPGLLQRRMIEANLYLNGVYGKTVPANFKYILFNTNNDAAVCEVKVQGFDSTVYDGVRAIPVLSGYRFLGWYTKAEGGEWVTSVGPDTTVSTVYAHWQKGEGTSAGTAANYVRYASEKGQAVYDTYATTGKQMDKLDASEKVTIVADYVDANKVKWGKLSTGGWINLNETSAKKVEATEPMETLAKPVDVVVLRNGVNIRSGPGTNYTSLGTFSKDQGLTITAVQQGGRYLWGKSGLGWICLDYTDYELASALSSGDATKVTATGVIINTDVLNVRSGPGAGNTKVGEYKRGDEVKITLQQKVSTTTWGLTEKGWISLYYVKVTPVKEGEVPDIEFIDPTEPTEPEATTPETESPEKEPESSESAKVIGTVVNCTALNIRSGAGTNNPKVGKLACYTSVEILEQTTVKGQLWGRIDKGWVSMNYIEIATSGTGTTEGTGATVVKCTNLNIRAGAGTNYNKVGRLAKGTRVQILETTTVNGATWGRTVKGWVHMYYIQLDPVSEIPSTPETETPETEKPETEKPETEAPESGTTGTEKVIMTGVIYKTDSLRVRSGPGTDKVHVGDLKRGEKVEIYEVVTVGRSSWGRIDKGWILLYYVQTETVVNEDGTVVKTVTSTTLNIREAAGTKNAIVGKYYRGAQIVILEETQVNGTAWGRTDQGWVCLDYVK